MVRQLNPDESYIALDVGAARIGAARAGAIARLPEPLPAIKHDAEVFNSILALLKNHNAGLLVVGMPRNLKGEETEQSGIIRQFGSELAKHIEQEIVYVDESLSSKRADSFLAGNKRAAYDQDSVAACFILEEFFTTIGGQA